jgi:hypothetical protein
MNEHREKIRGTIIVASGATFDFLCGRSKQAPVWRHEANIEWVYRLTKDLRRLRVRYLIYDLIFVVMFILQLSGFGHSMRGGKERSMTDLISAHSSLKGSGEGQEHLLFTCSTDQ